LNKGLDVYSKVLVIERGSEQGRERGRREGRSGKLFYKQQ
jgi:hypothetical protein